MAPPVYDSWNTGQLAVTSTATQVADRAGASLIILSAPSSNTAPVFIGPSGVTTSTGIALSPGQSRQFYGPDLSRVYAIAAANQTLTWEEYR